MYSRMKYRNYNESGGGKGYLGTYRQPQRQQYGGQQGGRVQMVQPFYNDFTPYTTDYSKGITDVGSAMQTEAMKQALARIDPYNAQALHSSNSGVDYFGNIVNPDVYKNELYNQLGSYKAGEYEKALREISNPDKKKRGVLSRIFDALGAGGHAIRNTLSSATDVGKENRLLRQESAEIRDRVLRQGGTQADVTKALAKNKSIIEGKAMSDLGRVGKGFTDGVKHLNVFNDEADKYQKTYTSDLFDKWGWESRAGVSNAFKEGRGVTSDEVLGTMHNIGRGVAGFLGDVVTDPLSYLNVGAGQAVKDVALGSGRNANVPEKMVRDLARKSGADSEKVLKYINNISKRSAKDITFGMDNLNIPFFSQALKDYRGETARVIGSTKSLVDLGDKTIAPSVNRVSDAIKKTRLWGKIRPGSHYEATQMGKGVEGMMNLARNKIANDKLLSLRMDGFKSLREVEVTINKAFEGMSEEKKARAYEALTSDVGVNFDKFTLDLRDTPEGQALLDNVDEFRKFAKESGLGHYKTFQSASELERKLAERVALERKDIYTKTLDNYLPEGYRDKANKYISGYADKEDGLKKSISKNMTKGTIEDLSEKTGLTTNQKGKFAIDDLVGRHNVNVDKRKGQIKEEINQLLKEATPIAQTGNMQGINTDLLEDEILRGIMSAEGAYDKQGLVETFAKRYEESVEYALSEIEEVAFGSSGAANVAKGTLKQRLEYLKDQRNDLYTRYADYLDVDKAKRMRDGTVLKQMDDIRSIIESNPKYNKYLEMLAFLEKDGAEAMLANREGLYKDRYEKSLGVMEKLKSELRNDYRKLTQAPVDEMSQIKNKVKSLEFREDHVGARLKEAKDKNVKATNYLSDLEDQIGDRLDGAPKEKGLTTFSKDFKYKDDPYAKQQLIAFNAEVKGGLEGYDPIKSREILEREITKHHESLNNRKYVSALFDSSNIDNFKPEMIPDISDEMRGRLTKAKEVVAGLSPEEKRVIKDISESSIMNSNKFRIHPRDLKPGTPIHEALYKTTKAISDTEDYGSKINLINDLLFGTEYISPEIETGYGKYILKQIDKYGETGYPTDLKRVLNSLNNATKYPEKFDGTEATIQLLAEKVGKINVKGMKQLERDAYTLNDFTTKKMSALNKQINDKLGVQLRRVASTDEVERVLMGALQDGDMGLDEFNSYMRMVEDIKPSLERKTGLFRRVEKLKDEYNEFAGKYRGLPTGARKAKLLADEKALQALELEEAVLSTIETFNPEAAATNVDKASRFIRGEEVAKDKWVDKVSNETLAKKLKQAEGRVESTSKVKDMYQTQYDMLQGERAALAKETQKVMSEYNPGDADKLVDYFRTDLRGDLPNLSNKEVQGRLENFQKAVEETHTNLMEMKRSNPEAYKKAINGTEGEKLKDLIDGIEVIENNIATKQKLQKEVAKVDEYKKNLVNTYEEFVTKHMGKEEAEKAVRRLRYNNKYTPAPMDDLGKLVGAHESNIKMNKAGLEAAYSDRNKVHGIFKQLLDVENLASADELGISKADIERLGLEKVMKQREELSKALGSTKEAESFLAKQFSKVDDLKSGLEAVEATRLNKEDVKTDLVERMKAKFEKTKSDRKNYIEKNLASGEGYTLEDFMKEFQNALPGEKELFQSEIPSIIDEKLHFLPESKRLELKASFISGNRKQFFSDLADITDNESIMSNVIREISGKDTDEILANFNRASGIDVSDMTFEEVKELKELIQPTIEDAGFSSLKDKFKVIMTEDAKRKFAEDSRLYNGMLENLADDRITLEEFESWLEKNPNLLIDSKLSEFYDNSITGKRGVGSSLSVLNRSADEVNKLAMEKYGVELVKGSPEEIMMAYSVSKHNAMYNIRAGHILEDISVEGIKYYYDGKLHLPETARAYVSKATLERINEQIMEGAKLPKYRDFLSDVGAKAKGDEFRLPWGDIIEVPRDKLKKLSPDLLREVRIADGTAFDRAKQMGIVQYRNDVDGFLKLYDKFTRMFKISQTAVNPGFHLRNARNNEFQTWLGAGSKALDPKHKKMAHEIVTGGNGQLIVESTGEILDYDMVREYGAAYGLFDTGLVSDTLRGSLGRRKNTGPKSVKEAIEKHDPLNVMSRFGNYIDNTSKVANFTHYLKEGLDPQEAAELTQKFLFNYNDITDFERNVLRRIVPFYTFTSKNLPLQVEQLIEQPGKYRNLMYALEGVKNMTPEEDRVDDEYMPHYTKDWIQTPLQITNREGRQEHMFIDPSLPTSSLGKLDALIDPEEGKRELLSMLNPLITTPLEVKQNKNFFFDEDIKRYDEHEKYPAYLLKDVIGDVDPRYNHVFNKTGLPKNIDDYFRKTGRDRGFHAANHLGGVKMESYDYEQFKYFMMLKKLEELRENR